MTGRSVGGNYTTEFDMIVQIEILGLSEEEFALCGDQAEISEVDDTNGEITKSWAPIEKNTYMRAVVIQRPQIELINNVKWHMSLYNF